MPAERPRADHSVDFSGILEVFTKKAQLTGYYEAIFVWYFAGERVPVCNGEEIP